ncbi:MAG: hypothetical protein FJ202_00110 [Gemmatimonadetes bacterium]|nr:hypothetical protein [Gemmatimonadota bacterium]
MTLTLVTRDACRFVRSTIALGVGISVLGGMAACRPQGLSLGRLSPAVGTVSRGEVVEVVITGRGFDSLNTVHFGPIELRNVPRRTATEIRFVVPIDDSMRPLRGEAPPQPLTTGPYDVSITTSRGRSNALRFMLTGAP